MTDPNLPPERVVHQTTINTAPPPRKSGGGAGLAFLVGGLIVAVAVIAWFVFAGGRAPAQTAPDLNVDINVPTPRMPDLPDRPAPPPSCPSPAKLRRRLRQHRKAKTDSGGRRRIAGARSLPS